MFHNTVTRVLIALAVWVVAITAVQAQELSMKVDIPFDFVLTNGQTFASGTYFIRESGIPNVVRLEEVAGNRVHLIGRVSQSADHLKPALVFNRYGSQYFLRAVQSADRIVSIPITRVEREVQRLASVKPTRVQVAMSRQ